MYITYCNAQQLHCALRCDMALHMILIRSRGHFPKQHYTKLLVFVMEMGFILCAVGTEILFKFQSCG
jgi:hypothetical protein